MKLNYKRTLLVGFAFFLISAFWQAYDTIVPKIMTDKFGLAQSISGAVMALDNIFALFLLPFFGALSDRVMTKRGRRTPFILMGTLIAAVLLVSLSFPDSAQLKNLDGVTATEGAAYEEALGTLWDADLSVYLAPAAHRHGIGRTFYALLEDILDQQDYHNIYALVSSANEISTAFHRALGYDLMTVMPKTGFKFGQWYDMYWFHKRLCPPDAPTHRPTPFEASMLGLALKRLEEPKVGGDEP